MRVRRTKEIQREIEEVLRTDWDPIGVIDEPEAKDEYSSYVGGIYRLLHARASALKIAEHLREIEMESMGLDPGAADGLILVAERLLALDVSLGSSTGGAG